MRLESELTRTWWDKAPRGVLWEHGAHCIEFARPRMAGGVTFYALTVERVYGENDSDIVMFGGNETLHHRFHRMLLKLTTAHTSEQVAALWAAPHDEEAIMPDNTPMRSTQCGRARGVYPAAIRLHIAAAIIDDLRAWGDDNTLAHAFDTRRQYVEVLEFWLRAVRDAIPHGNDGLTILKQHRKSPAFPFFGNGHDLTATLSDAMLVMETIPEAVRPSQFLLNAEKLLSEHLVLIKKHIPN